MLNGPAQSHDSGISCRDLAIRLKPAVEGDANWCQEKPRLAKVSALYWGN
jgi:hypothetical protein